jgi:hypothetical protein
MATLCSNVKADTTLEQETTVEKDNKKIGSNDKETFFKKLILYNYI